MTRGPKATLPLVRRNGRASLAPRRRREAHDPDGGPPASARLALYGATKRERDRNLRNRVLGERDAHGVADSFFEKHADADRRLDAAVLAVPGLGDSDVQRVVHAESVSCGAPTTGTRRAPRPGWTPSSTRRGRDIPSLADANELERGF